MPRISDEKRAARRQQILEAAWRCFQKEGLHATTMDDIIRACGLSAGAVYSYFPSKDELIAAAVTTSLAGIEAILAPVLGQRPLPPPAEAIAGMAAIIDGFTRREGYDLKRIALLGWSEAQRNEALRQVMAGFYGAFRTRLESAAAVWQAAGLCSPSATPQEIAKTMLALLLGYVIEAAILHDVEPEALRRGLAALDTPPKA